MTEEKNIHKCEECGMSYKEEDLAKQCQAWCKEHGTCNVEITKNAIENNSNSCSCC